MVIKTRCNMQVAHKTKAFCSLFCDFGCSRFVLSQSDDGKTNGSALWLGAQVLSVYLQSILKTTTGTAIELGAGIGLTSLTLASMGWNVVATDLYDVISTVLDPNITNNLLNLPASAGIIQTRELDWTVPLERWTWEDARLIASSRQLSPLHNEDLLKPPFDLIISSDTLYSPLLIHPLLRAIHSLCVTSASRSPQIYLCLERRDPLLIDRALHEARETWGFKTTRVAHKKVVKALANLNWEKEDWEGIEIWRFIFRKQEITVQQKIS